jgi:hypothetical protein
VEHVLVATIDPTRSPVVVPDPGSALAPPPAITGRASPPGSLVASHTSLLV